MATRRYASFTARSLDDVGQRLQEWSTRGLDAVIKDGMNQFGNDLQWAAYKNMTLPTVGKNSPLNVGLRWRRTNQFHSEARPGAGASEWIIRVQPQYLAMWQEYGTRPHTVFDPNKQRGMAFRRIKNRKTRAEERLTKLSNIQNRTDPEERRKRYAENSIKKREAELQSLIGAAGTNAVMGYSAQSQIPRKNQASDWFRGNTPTAEAGRRRGQPRPVQVRAGQKIQVNKGVQATRPIWRGAIAISGKHRDRMARLLTNAYRGRTRTV